jgi:hypothetical protein
MTFTKASMLLGIRAILLREGRLDRVAEKCPPAARALLDSPPISSEWIASERIEEVLEAVQQIDGPEMCRKLGRQSVTESMVPLMRSFAAGMLRLFGGSPHTLLSRLDDLTKLTNRGIEVRYERTGERAAKVSFRYPHRGAMPMSSFHTQRGALEATLDFCSAPGTASVPRVLPGENGAEYDLRW